MTKRPKIEIIPPGPPIPPGDEVTTVQTFPSGATMTTVTGRGFRMVHLEMPYHEVALIDLLLGRKP